MLPKEYISPYPWLAEALAEEAPVSLRVNRAKGVAPPTGAESVPWCPAGCYLDGRRPFTWDPSLHQGLYYVQDASSMIVHWAVARAAEAIGGDGGLMLLDACAAPGGKSTAALDALPAGSLVVANEYVAARAAVLAENVAKWGAPAAVVTRGPTSRLARLHEAFDIVVADVPCSGEGMFRKEPQAVAQWSPALVADCARLQRTILGDVWEALRPGGVLIYSTCTFNRAENEEQLAWLLASRRDAVAMAPDLPAEWGALTGEGCIHFVPGRVRGEGQTIFMVAKGAPCPPRRRRAGAGRPAGGKRRSEPGVSVEAGCRLWLDRPEEYAIELRGGGASVAALPVGWADEVGMLSRTLDVVAAGVEVATVKGRTLVPTQQLALSTALRRGAFPEVAVGYAEAVAYLRREAPALAGSTPRGYVLLTYGGRPLGFANNLGNRANNLYPAPWRILSTHAPALPPQILDAP